MRLMLTPDERALILKRRADAKQRTDERAALMQQLYDALALPIDEALPVVKRFLNADFKLVFDPRVTKWCADNSKAILADHEASNPRSK